MIDFLLFYEIIKQFFLTNVILVWKKLYLIILNIFKLFCMTQLVHIFSTEHRPCYPANVCVQSKDRECCVPTLTECISLPGAVQMFDWLKQTHQEDMCSEHHQHNGKQCSAFMWQLGHCLVGKTAKKIGKKRCRVWRLCPNVLRLKQTSPFFNGTHHLVPSFRH